MVTDTVTFVPGLHDLAWIKAQDGTLYDSSKIHRIDVILVTAPTPGIVAEPGAGREEAP